MTQFSKQQIARQFSRAAETYDQAAQLQNEMALQLISQIPSQANGNLVDLGCGTGWALERLVKLEIGDGKNKTKRFEISAVDIAPGMIEVARGRAPNAKFSCCDLEETKIEDNFAQVIFSNAAIQWCDASSAFEEMKRIGRTGCTIVCSTFGPQTLREIKSAWQETGDSFGRVHDFESCESLRSKMKTSGLRNVEAKSELREFKFDSVRNLLQSIKQLGATNASSTRQTGLMGPKRYRGFCGALESRLAEAGYLELTFECIFLSATV